MNRIGCLLLAIILLLFSAQLMGEPAHELCNFLYYQENHGIICSAGGAERSLRNRAGSPSGLPGMRCARGVAGKSHFAK
ncbi:MAG: hypothetical protein D6814_07250 [Calditrichaeota bacterium]|nr:MAG: hypothetical protein D6814_07250 [Calditrichota bacterium]